MWEDVFERLLTFLDTDIDVCIISSGLYSEKLSSICEANDWSYLSTQKNKLTLAQNIAISLHPSAEWIYKLDEDIFITKGYFRGLMDTYENAMKEGMYNIGFVGALLSIHGYGSMAILEKLGKVESTREIFGDFKYGEMTNNPTYTNPNFARYMWGDGLDEMKDIDSVAAEFKEKNYIYTIAPFRYAIGAILMRREIWEDMGKFPVVSGWNMGVDEVHLNQYCFMNSKVIIIAQNTLVGHFAYYNQNKSMRDYYCNHREVFRINGNES